MPNSYEYEVLLTPEAESVYISITGKKASQELDAMLDALSTAPRIGRVYDPLYEAARPDIENLLVAYAAHFGIYYIVNEEDRRVLVLSIEDQRRDPLTRFSHLV